jgi:branched-chain amino acid transport system permease protein
MPMLTRFNGPSPGGSRNAPGAALSCPSFWTGNIIGRAIVYGIVAMSLTFLASYGGFISLAQTMIAGIAGYTVAVLAPTAIPLGNHWLPYGH